MAPCHSVSPRLRLTIHHMFGRIEYVGKLRSVQWLIAVWLGIGILASANLSAQQPYVVGSFPRNGDSKLLRNLFISIKIALPADGQEIDMETLNGDNIRLYPSGSPFTQIECWIHGSSEIKNITLQPKVILSPNTTYIFEITTGLQDNKGLPFKPFRSVFRTGAVGLDKPATAPPGYGRETREFAFKPTEGVTKKEPKADYTDLVGEQDELLDYYDKEDDGDGGFLVDIDALMAGEEEDVEIVSYRPDEAEMEDDLMFEFEEEEESDPLDAEIEEEEMLAMTSSLPEVEAEVSPARKSKEEDNIEIPDLLTIEVEEDMDMELAEEAEVMPEIESTKEVAVSNQPQPQFGYLMEMERYRQQARGSEEEIKETEFLDFESTFKSEESFVELRWEMASEFDNDYFSIERSQDGRTFTLMDTLHSLSDGEKALYYLKNDTEAPIGTNYYRVAYHTRKGEKGYSGIQSVEVLEKEHIRFGKTAIFPNTKLPLEFQLNEARQVTVLITTDKGVPVKKISGTIGPGLTRKAINMQGVPSGTYMASIDASSIRTRRQVVVLR